MTIKKRASLRKRIDENCKSCVYDRQLPGSWRQQVTLCTVASCALFTVRPKTKAPLPKSVLAYYGITSPEIDVIDSSRPLEGGISRQALPATSGNSNYCIAAPQGQERSVSELTGEIVG